MFYLYWQQEPALSLGLGLSDFISFFNGHQHLRKLDLLALRYIGGGLSAFIIQAVESPPPMYKPLLSLSLAERLTNHDSRFTIHDFGFTTLNLVKATALGLLIDFRP